MSSKCQQMRYSRQAESVFLSSGPGRGGRGRREQRSEVFQCGCFTKYSLTHVYDARRVSYSKQDIMDHNTLRLLCLQ